MIGELGLPNASAVKARAQDYAPGERFDTVIARALASTPELLEISGHLVREDGVLLAQKGKHPAKELEAVKSVPGWDYSVTELTVPGLASHRRHVVSLRRNATWDQS
jgi:16S rRNA (guanine527-N7)-methyltransferase